jgi:hypothetical protein
MAPSEKSEFDTPVRFGELVEPAARVDRIGCFLRGSRVDLVSEVLCLAAGASPFAVSKCLRSTTPENRRRSRNFLLLNLLRKSLS